MTNRDVEAAIAYHNDTKHSLLSIHSEPHYLDFSNQPLPYKIYTELDPIPLPREIPPSGVGALDAVASDGSFEGESVPGLPILASLLHHAAGITKKRTFPGGEIHFRAAACTGALYHVELYLVCGDLPGLEAGVYHFGVHDFSLTRLRSGDYRANLVQASGGQEAIAQAPSVVVCTSTFWRNSWKYRSRAYRHCFWDNGTILANLLAMSAAHRIPTSIVAGFVDSMVSELLDLDTQQEVALTLVPLGRATDPTQGEALPTPGLGLETMPLSRTQVDYPAIRQMHQASCLDDPDQARDARNGPTEAPPPPSPSGREFPLGPPSVLDAADTGLEAVVKRRGSSRQFAREPVTLKQLSTILTQSTRGVPADFLDPLGTSLCRLYLIVNDVMGLPSGSYFFDREAGSLEMLEEGDFRNAGGYLGLQQDIPADASVDVFFLTDLDHALARYGNRGYRAAQLEAGIVGGKMYLSAYAQRLGASGLTFFDDDVTSFFSPHAEGLAVMFLVALGVPARRR
ncbi:MAG: SagB/ThcOx family dehydrogenase [Dehalococcoidia bacterium]|nr:SagB/ThcOx family dehydrogenase [Dehalococcoidia bacterium]